MRGGWVKKTLGEVCLVERGSSPRPIETYLTDSSDGVNWVKIGDTKNVDKYIRSTRQKITRAGAEKSRRVDPGDFILSNSMSFGKPYIMATSGYVHDGWFILRLLESIDIDFFHYLLSSDLVQAQFLSLAAGSVVKNISKDLVKRAILPIPPRPEQKRIVAILDEAFEGIDRAIANTEKNLANARELFENYLNTIFTQKGDGWEEKKLEDICSIKHGFAFKGEFFTNNPSQYILLTPGSFHESGGYREQGEKTKYYVGEVPDTYILRKGDFLFVMTEQAVGLLGSSLIVPESNRFLHNQRLGLVQLFNGFEWHNDFFFHQFNTQGFRAAVQSSASGVKVRHTSPKKLGAIKVFFPRTKAEQKAVADTLNELYAETQRLEAIYRQKIAALKELKQSILQKAFTGELTADNANQVKKTAKEVNAA